jgi:uncharacterized protein YbjT (DUF2867 family)
MILVTGAAGKTGRAVIRALKAKGAAVRALVRNPDHAGALIALGASEVAVGAFDDPGALARAAHGITAVYHICPNVSRDELDYARAVVAAIRANGVSRFVYHSVLHPQIEAMPHHWQKMRTEEMLFAQDLDLTVLQPTAYMQNLLVAWRGIVENGVFRVPYPVESRLSLVDLDNLGEVAAIVLTAPGHVGAVYELCGTVALSQIQVAAELAAALMRPVRAEAETVEAWEQRMCAGGMGEYERETLAAMMRYYARHGLVGNPNTLTRLLGRAPVSLEQFAARAGH